MALEALLARLKAAGTPNADEGAGDGAGNERVAATPDDEGTAAGSDNFLGVPVFQVFHNENDLEESVAYYANRLEHLPPEPVFRVFRADKPDAAERGTKRAVLSVYFIGMQSPLGEEPVLDLSPIDVEKFSERAAVLEFDAGLTRAEAERQAANEQGVATPEELYPLIAEGWAERLRELATVERSPRGRHYIAAALRFCICCGKAATEL